MKIKLLIGLILTVLLVSCSNQKLEKELSAVQLKLKETEALLAAAKSNTDENYPLIHVVYFKLKPDADKTKLLEAIDKLKQIDVVHKLEVGTFEDLNDERALSDYQVVMQMAFANKAAYGTYQTHEIHLALKSVIKDMLAGPPVTYDYRKLNI